MSDKPVALRPAIFRWQVFAVHLGLTLMALGGLTLLLLGWFPGYLFELEGGWQALRLMIGVGLVLGPLLTLLVAGPRKTVRALKLDLALIGLLQVLALAWTLWAAWEQRTYAVFWIDGTLYSRPWAAFVDEPAAVEKIAQMELESPAWITINLPASLEARTPYMREAYARNSAVDFDPRLYVPFDAHSPAVIAASRNRVAGGLSARIRHELAQGAVPMNALASGKLLLLPARSSYGKYYLVLDAGTGNVIHRFRK